MTADKDKLKRRVVVAIDDFSVTDAIIENAADLAASLSAELLGVLVEQSDFLEAADLPVTSLISFGGEEIMPVDASTLRRGMRVRARTIKSQISKISERLKIPWSFQTGEAAILDEILKSTHQGDVLALGLTRKRTSQSSHLFGSVHIAEQANCSLFIVRQSRPSQRAVVAMYTRPDRDSADTLALASGLARSRRRQLYILPLAGNKVDADEKALQLALKGLDESIEAITLPAQSGDAETLFAQLEHIRPSYLVMDRETLQSLGVDAQTVSDRLNLDGLIVVGCPSSA